MKSILRSKKGLSIVELIIAVTLLAICTVPLMAGFANVAAINRMTKNQIEVNAVLRLVQEQLIDHIKKGDQVEYYDSMGSIKNDKNIWDGSSYIEIKNGVVRENSSTINSNFRFNAKCKSWDNTNKICEYNVILYKKKGSSYTQVQKFMVTSYVN